ncbi:MAG TPA: aldehyde ferredoxin oxidoreductase family protein [Clostridia bacterium]|nr:aldehyde ferredoxin oxidoreductase family protein [Clostridia bacterium]
MDSYAGYVLRVNLTTKEVKREPLRRDWARDFIGGKGLGYRYLCEDVDPLVDPLSPANEIIFMTGPLSATLVPCTGKCEVITKSPATGTILNCAIGGSLANQLKFAGYDALIITGKAPSPVYLRIKDDDVSFVDAKGLWGKGCHETEEAIRSSEGPFTVACIGPGGENLVPMACITSEFYRQAGRGGVGAVMGSKNLKAIAVSGTGYIGVDDMPGFLDLVYRKMKEETLTDANLWAYTDGTSVLVEASQAAGILPTRNFQDGTFEGFEGISARAVKGARVHKKACFGCPLGCGNYISSKGVFVEGPEYETLALAGSNCGIGDLSAVARFNALCDDLGIDTISAGNTAAFAMELAQRGIADLGLRFGEVDSYLEVPSLIAYRKGIGEDLALGVRHLSSKYGGRKFAMEVKGLEFPGYEPRGSWGMSLAYATSDRGACHMRAWPVADEAYGSLDPFTFEGKAQLVIDGQHRNAVKFSSIVCDFWAISLESLAEILSKALSREMSADDLILTGERIWNLGRLFNVACGMRRKDDTGPDRIFEEPLKTGSAASRMIPREGFEAALSEYYRLRGWDEDGVPTREKVESLGLGELRLGG